VTALVHERFLRAAAAHPSAIAVQEASRSLTYEECRAAALGFAATLREELAPGARVAFALPKGAEAIVTMLGTLLAGMTYLPIDVGAPAERQLRILQTGADALVCDPATVQRLRAQGRDAGADVPPHLPADAILAMADRVGAASAPAVPSDRLAYILFTSGSTGVPKGVAISHANAAHFVGWAIDHFAISPTDRLAVHAPLHFDLPVLDVYAGLGTGATVCPIDERTVLFPSALRRFLIDRAITILYAVPSAWIALLERGDLAPGDLSLRLALYAGEEFHVASLARLMQRLRGTRVFNLYGPIETNAITVHEVAPGDLERPHIPLGAAIDGVQLVVADETGRAIGTPSIVGEICVSGPPVSPGYLAASGLAPSRRSVTVGGRSVSCYPTGDFARWEPDGTLMLCGRRDGLVKTRGFRVEIGDVEAALMRHPDVAQAAVFPVDDPQHTKVLHAAVAARPGRAPSAGELAAFCRRTLPGYMVPVRLDLVESMRHTSTGKIDRNAVRAALTPAAMSA